MERQPMEPSCFQRFLVVSYTLLGQYVWTHAVGPGVAISVFEVRFFDFASWVHAKIPMVGRGGVSSACQGTGPLLDKFATVSQEDTGTTVTNPTPRSLSHLALSWVGTPQRCPMM